MRLKIFISKQSGPGERYAAEELQKYLRLIHHIEAEVCGDPVSESHDHEAAIVLGRPRRVPGLTDDHWPALSPDGYCLRTVRATPDVLVIGGGSDRGTLFAVYEFIERWGVRFLLSGDVLPERPDPFTLTGFDEVVEPEFPLRAMRPMANVTEGAAAWSPDEFAEFIDQMIKLKFNAFVFVILESGPWLDYEFRGTRRPAGDIFYGYRFPIDEHFIGKELFPGQSEFYSPVLASADDERRRRSGMELVRGIIAHCKSRGILCILTFSLLEPPTLFKRLCNKWATLPLPDPKSLVGAVFSVTPTEEFGINPEYAAWMNMSDPVIRELTACRLRALVEAYPDADAYHLWVSEHRAGVGSSEEIFSALDAKYKVSPEFTLEEALRHSERSPFDKARHEHQTQGDLLFLYALDNILNEGPLGQDLSSRKISLGVAGVMPQLAPLTTRILPKDSVLVQFLDYGAHGPADRVDTLVPLLDEGIPATLEIGIHDDNNMYFPQIVVESLEVIARATAGHGLKGYVGALWQVRQADINAAYLSAFSWKPHTTAAEFYADFLPRLVGATAAPDFERALRIIEAADREIRLGLLYGYAFIMRPTLIPALIEQGVDRAGILRIKPRFERALAFLESAANTASRGGLPHVTFWRVRTLFAVKWLDMALSCDDLGKVLGKQLPPGATLAPDQKERALSLLDALLDQAAELTRLIIGDTMHKGDLGQIAAINQHVSACFRQMRAEIAGRA